MGPERSGQRKSTGFQCLSFGAQCGSRGASLQHTKSVLDLPRKNLQVPGESVVLARRSGLATARKGAEISRVNFFWFTKPEGRRNICEHSKVLLEFAFSASQAIPIIL